MNALPEFMQWLVAFTSLGTFVAAGWGIIKVGRWMGVMETRVGAAQETASIANERIDKHLEAHLI